MNRDSKIPYTMTVKLPSKGIPYKDEYPELSGDIVLRMMGTEDEKIIFGSVSDMNLSKLLKNCVTNIELDPDILLEEDRYFLLVKLRILTYGSDYHTLLDERCSSCESELGDMKFSLDDVFIHELPDDFIEPIEVELPLSKDKIGLRLLRYKEAEKIRLNIKKKSKELKLDFSETLYMEKTATYIVKINGEDVSRAKALDYFKGLYGRDSAYLKHTLDKINVGYSSTIDIECPNCGNLEPCLVRLNSEFFRPRFD